MKISLFDVRPYPLQLQAEIESAVLEVLRGGRYVSGPKVEALEASLAGYCETAHAVAVGSGTDALLLSLLSEGVDADSEVVLPAFTFFATAGAVLRAGARPVLVDSRESDLLMDCGKALHSLTAKTKAVIPVHLFGKPMDLEALVRGCSSRGISLIEDAAQSLGAKSPGGMAGSIGDYGCLSFYPTKTLGAAGEAGMVLTSDTAKAETLRALRNQGGLRRYRHDCAGGNHRMDEVQAAILSVKLKGFREAQARRESLAARYLEILGSSRSVRDGRLRLPCDAQSEPIEERHAWGLFVVRIPNRDEVATVLRQRGVSCDIYYPEPLHLQPALAHLGFGPGDFPVAEQAAREVLALPMHPHLVEGDVDIVCRELLRALA